MSNSQLRSDVQVSAYRRIAVTLAANWWTLAIRGILGILFGLAALVLQGVPMLSFVQPFTTYAMVDGVFGIAGAVRDAREGERSGLLIAEGLINVAAAASASLWQAITVLVFVVILATWAMLTGVVMLAVSSRLEAKDGRWWFALSGVVSIVYGVLLVIATMTGAVVLTAWFGAYALAFGIALLVAAFKLKARFD
jgi:uncharacterized membrane protein HdeD (DUF308 family)